MMCQICLDAAVRLGLAAGVAIGLGLGIRVVLLHFLPELQLWALLIRATVLCVFGIGIYVAGARLLGVHELAEIEGTLLRKLNPKRRT